MNKKADTSDALIILLIFYAIIFFVISIFSMLQGIKDEGLCKEECNNAITYQVKSTGSIYDFLIGENGLSCICFYANEIKTKAVRE